MKHSNKFILYAKIKLRIDFFLFKYVFFKGGISRTPPRDRGTPPYTAYTTPRNRLSDFRNRLSFYLYRLSERKKSTVSPASSSYALFVEDYRKK